MNCERARVGMHFTFGLLQMTNADPFQREKRMDPPLCAGQAPDRLTAQVSYCVIDRRSRIKLGVAGTN